MKRKFHNFLLSLILFKSSLSYEIFHHVEHNKNDKYAIPDPEAPTITELYALSACELEVVWECSSSCYDNLDRFKVYWQEEGSQDISIFSSGIQSNYHDIGGLNSDQSYTVWIASIKEDEEHNSDPEDASTKRGVPKEVTGITAETQSDTIITVSWNKTTSVCPIKGYSISWNGKTLWDEFLSQSGSLNVSEDSTSYDVAYLTPYSYYEFYVNEITFDGEVGGSSHSTSATTEPGPPGPPESVISLTLGKSSVEVKWAYPKEINSGGIIGYHISCQLLPDTNDLCDIDPGEHFAYVVKDLLDCGEYTFSVQAINVAGIGEAATTKSRTDPKEPPGIKTFACENSTSTSLFLTWELDTNCPVSQYLLDGVGEVLWNEETDSFNQEITTEDNFYLLDSLIPWTSYNLTFRATTEGGTTGSVSHIVETLEGAAGPPVIVNSSAIDSHRVWLGWNSPEEKNGAITGYFISSKNELIPSDEFNITTDKDASSYMIDSLYACGDYTFTVQAINGGGFGEEDDTKSTTLPESPPPVTEVTVLNATSTYVTINFKPPEKTCPILSYDVKGEGEIISGGDAKDYSKALDGGTDTYILDDLEANTNYNFNITSTTLGGTSDPVSFTATTKEDD